MLQRILFLFLFILLNFSLGAGEPLSDITLITPKDKDFMSPKWSPDGSKISITTPKYKGIYIIELDGKNLTQIVSGDSAGFNYNWSKDGKKIAFRTIKESKGIKTSTISIVTLSNKEIKNLFQSTEDVGFPVWDKNGNICFSHKNEIISFDENGERKKLFQGINSMIIQFSKDGNFTVFTDDTEQIWIADLKNDNRKRISEGEGPYFSPIISPDDEKILFKKLGGPLYVKDIKKDLLYSIVDGANFSWSPDSKKIIFQIAKDDGHDIVSSDIYLVNFDGTDLLNLTNTKDKMEIEPSFSPDGKKIAFSTLKGEIYTAILNIKE